MKTTIAALFMGAAAITPTVAQQNYFTNPVVAGDVADPTVIRIDSTYYITGTSSEWAPYYPIFSSPDLVNWQQIGHVFQQKPKWTKSSFWAPEWFARNGKIYVYYTARKESDNISCIGVAVADSPTGTFTDHGPVVEFGKEAIDAFVLEDSGQLYMSWKAYGLDDRPIELLACKLSDDGLRLEGKPFSLLRDDDRRGMEGQQWFKHGNYYYLIYAANDCCGQKSDYAVSVARSRKLEGPYETYRENPILHGGKEILSIGHGTLTTTSDGRMFFLCHAYLQGSGFFQGRQPHLQEMKMGEDGWPRFVTGEYASLIQPMPLETCVQKPVADFADNFHCTTLKPEWSWNYPFVDVYTQLNNGKLTLSGASKPDVKTGAALCLRPTSPHYTLETAVLNSNDSWKGVVMYGDAKNLITIGCQADRLALKLVSEGIERRLVDLPLPASVLHLRMRVTDGVRATFSWSLDGQTWQTLTGTLPDEVINSLVRWDRISRPGLYHEGNVKHPAQFGYCRLTNNPQPKF